ncbi:MAG: polysaccharide pyruvyl transferase family protein [Mangrovibacterium sp.]
MLRKEFIKQAGIFSFGSALFLKISCSTGKKVPNILVLGGGKDMDINIGSFIHTSGLLQVLENDFPQSKIILWKKSKNDVTESLLKKYFPSIEIVSGIIDKENNIESTEVKRAIDVSDILIQVSGASVATDHLQAWVKRAPQKPFGIFGVTIENISGSLASLLNKAAFVFTRETTSMKILHQAGITCRNIEFVPDTAFRTNYIRR